ncbi:MAG: sulfite exporter TauE/SafE family protein [Planctomycetia bacterium]|nr:sulfite exporter TauE/SafE family protein [Planctomycetia bacterium]
MTTLDYLLLCAAAALAGGINAVAGGGTLLTFPTLIAILSRTHDSSAAAVLANGTSTVALFPASMAALWGLRREFALYAHWSAKLIPPSIVGGIGGTLLVTELPKELFARLVPWLILTAASLFTLQPYIAGWMGIGKKKETAPVSERPAERHHGAAVAGVILFQFVVGIYGGYFGAGIGILMLSALAMMGMSDIHAMNGLKSLLGSCINGASVVVWIYQRKVDWSLAVPMAVAGCLGSYAAAHYSRRLPKVLIRRFVIAMGFSLAAFYFYKQWQATI